MDQSDTSRLQRRTGLLLYAAHCFVNVTAAEPHLVAVYPDGDVELLVGSTLSEEPGARLLLDARAVQQRSVGPGRNRAHLDELKRSLNWPNAPKTWWAPRVWRYLLEPGAQVRFPSLAFGKGPGPRPTGPDQAIDWGRSSASTSRAPLRLGDPELLSHPVPTLRADRLSG